MATTYLTRTGATPTTSNKYTFSCWVKRGSIGTTETIFRTYSDGSNSAQLIFDSDDTFAFQDIVGGTTVTNLKPSNLFRDTGAWMNFIVQVDYTQATAADRAKIFINGGEVSYSATTVQSQNGASMLNTANNNALGSNRSNSSHYFTGSMSQVNFIDGTAYPATAFGSVNATSGIWVANSGPTVTYGNNGFFLDMANSSDMGNDVSGNANDFTVGGGTVTQMEDTPDNNFATLNPLVQGTSTNARTFSNGNNTIVLGRDSASVSTLGVTSGKYYCEIKCVTDAANPIIGIAGLSSPALTNPWGGTNLVGVDEYGYVNDGTKKGNAGSFTSYGDTWTTGDIISIAYNATTGTLWFGKNGTWQNSATATEIANGTTTNSAFTGLSGTYFMGCCDAATPTGDTFSTNFGNGYFGTTPVSSAGTNASSNGIFEYDVPTGYTALSTEGLNS
jgi:hypothetical protein